MVNWPNPPNDILMVEVAYSICNIWLHDMMKSSNNIVISSLVDCSIESILSSFEKFSYIIQVFNICEICQHYHSMLSFGTRPTLPI